jgi:general stress protein 26
MVDRVLDSERDVQLEPMAELWEKIRSVRTAMLTTIDSNGRLRSRPMATQDKEAGKALWFFAGASSSKVVDIACDDRVQLSYASADKDLYVTVSGRARAYKNEAKARELWNAYAKAWFPGGPDDPNLALIEVTLEQAEYWHDLKPKVVQFAQRAVAALNGCLVNNLAAGNDRKLSF